MRNCAQLIFVARKMCKFAPTRKPVALETLDTALQLRTTFQDKDLIQHLNGGFKYLCCLEYLGAIVEYFTNYSLDS